MKTDLSDGVPIEIHDDADTMPYLRQYIHVIEQIDISDGVPLVALETAETEPSLPTDTRPTTGMANN